MKKSNIKTRPKKKELFPSYIRTSSFYGFLSASEYIKDFNVSKKDVAKTKLIPCSHKSEGYLEEKIALMRLFLEKKMNALPQPIMLFYRSPFGFEDKTVSYAHHAPTFNLDIIGNPKSIADAMIIETSYVISQEEYKDCELTVEINTVGDKDSLARLRRELTIFYKKNWREVPADIKPLYKKDIFESFRTHDKKCAALRERGPDPLRCLSENSRKHFKEVLEYLESLCIPYSMNHGLTGDLAYGSDTVFEIKALNRKTSEEKVVANGQRYNAVARKFWGKKDVPSIGANIKIKNHLLECKSDLKEKKYKLYFIQLGFEAKLKSMQVLEMLRKSKIDVYQSLSKDKMTAQIGLAEKMQIPYIIIMGQKEAMENSVVVRNMNTRSQDTVPLEELIGYIRKLK